MQDDSITIFSFSDQADDLTQRMAAAGFSGMTGEQADIVVDMGRLLDFAARKFSRFTARPESDLVERAANHALAMRMHGATLRGVKGAEMLEDLADAVVGRYEDPEMQHSESAELLTVDEAMTMLQCVTQVELARMLSVKPDTVAQWKHKGQIPNKNLKAIRRLYCGMQVRAAA